MKILLLLPTTLLATAGWLVARDEGSQSAARDAQECDARVRCTDDGSCIITCTRADGTECEIEIACDADGCRVVRCDSDGDCKPDEQRTSTAASTTRPASDAGAAAASQCAPSASCAPDAGRCAPATSCCPPRAH